MTNRAKLLAALAVVLAALAFPFVYLCAWFFGCYRPMGGGWLPDAICADSSSWPISAQSVLIALAGVGASWWSIRSLRRNESEVWATVMPLIAVVGMGFLVAIIGAA